MSSSRRSRTVLALAVNNWVSRAYLAAVALAVGIALCEDVFTNHSNTSMSYVASLVLTAPLNVLFVPAFGWLPTDTDAPFYLGVALAALVNAVVLGAAVRAVRKRRLSSARPATGA
ncbi:hypothetical protein [Streptomyces sp. NPDC002588]|uniref:SCO4225 family membrane protein n=1 Tax=Streptomyces sp. NPDC002588 TaxID=3154419 RepID=UPI003322613C